MRKNSKLSLIVLSLLMATVMGYGQTLRHVTVGEALEMARKNNATAKMADWDQKAANAQYHQADASFLPQVNLGYTAMTTNNPLNAFGFLLNQATVTAMDFDPNKLNDPGATQNYNASIEVKMPLLNVDMLLARQAGKYQEEVYKYKSIRTLQYIDFEVKKTYSQLQFTYEAQDVLESSLTKVRQIYQSVNNFYEQGLVQKSDVLNAEVQLNTLESALAKAKSSVLNASDGLQLVMGLDTEDSNEVYSADKLIQQYRFPERGTLESRADILAMDKALDASNSMLKSSKMSFLPRLNAFGTYQWNDDHIFKFDADSYLLGVNLSWTIFSGNQNRSKMRMYQFQRNKMQEERDLYIKQSRLELTKAERDLSDLQFEVNKHKTSVKQATEALRIHEDRYKEGLVSTTDLLQSQTQLSQQQLLLVQSVMSYNITVAYLEFLSEIN